MDSILIKVLDFVASLCLLFDVDWDKDFEDDAWVIEWREKHGVHS